MQNARAADVDRALQDATTLAPTWANTPPQERAAALQRAADALQADMPRLMGLLVREAGGKVCDFRGAALGKIDGRTALPRQIVAGNLKVAEALQKTIVSSGYAASFNG